MALRDVPITPGSGDGVKFDDKIQVVKTAYGAEGTGNLLEEKPATDSKLDTIVTALANLLTELQSKTEPANTQAVSESRAILDYQPGYHATGGSGNATIDPDLQTRVRGPVLTDEGSYRANFSGASLSLAIPNSTFVNGSDAVITAGDFESSTDLHKGDYIKLDADAESAWAQIDRMEPQRIYLAAPYSGAGGTGAASRVMLKPVTGSGASIAVANGAVTLTLGTTDAAITELERDVDYPPIMKQVGVAIDNRRANQDIYVGLYDEAIAPPRFYAWFHFDGTVNTTVKCESAFNASQAPSASEIETTTATIPNGKVTSQSIRYRIEVLNFRVRFYIDGVMVAEHFKSMPRPQDILTSTVRCVNGTGVGGATIVTVDYDAVRNFNFIDTEFPSESESIVATTPPLARLTGSVGANNTDFFVIDCQFVSLVQLRVDSVGGGGTISFQSSDDPAFGGTVISQQAQPGGGGNMATSTTAVGHWNIIPTCRYLRIRTTAYTSGTLTAQANVYGGMRAMLVKGHVDTSPQGNHTVVGAAADSSGTSGNPVLAAGRVRTGIQTDYADGDAANLRCDQNGRLIMAPIAADGGNRLVAYGAVPKTATGSTAIFGAQGASVRGALETIWLKNTGIGTGYVTLLDNTTEKARIHIGANMPDYTEVNFKGAIRTTANTALNLDLTTATNISLEWIAVGFKEF